MRDARNEVIANFLARSTTSLRSLGVLYQAGDYPNCMIILRSIIYRLLHLGHLQERDAYENFKQITLVERHKYLHRIKTDPLMANKEDDRFEFAYKLSSKIFGFLQKRGADRIKWSRMNPKEIAKQMKLGFIYPFGYEHASSYVHPMVDEGSDDISRLLGLPSRNLGADKRTILQNACLSIQLLLRNALLFADQEWDKKYYLFLDNIMHYTGTGGNDFLIMSNKLLQSLETSSDT